MGPSVVADRNVKWLPFGCHLVAVLCVAIIEEHDPEAVQGAREDLARDL